jgi:hypothetical protein
MESLIEIANKAIADYGFRQVVLWSPDDVIAQWDLSSPEAQVLKGPMLEALEALSIPVEPQDVPGEQDRFARLIGDALGMD